MDKYITVSQTESDAENSETFDYMDFDEVTEEEELLEDIHAIDVDEEFASKKKTVFLDRSKKKTRFKVTSGATFRVTVANAKAPDSDGSIIANPGTGDQKIRQGKSSLMNVQKGGEKATLKVRLASNTNKAKVTLTLK